MRTVRSVLIEDPAELEAYGASWDALAVKLGRPYCAPAWMLAWLRHAEPRVNLRTVVALDGERMVGIAPFCVTRNRLGLGSYSLLAAASCSPVEPLAEPGREREAAAAFASCLAGARPRADLLVLEGIHASSSWPSLIAAEWPGRRPRLQRGVSHPAPELRLSGVTVEGWLPSKSGNFRSQVRRSRRQLEAQGASFRMSRSPDELDRDLESFARLHHARWAHRGGSGALTPGVERMLRDAARDLISDERFRLFCIDVDGRTIAAEVFLAAGGELSYWLGGFDDAWAAQRPSILGIVAAIEDALQRGEARCDLGPGAQPYKYRLADGEQRAEWLTLVPPGPRAALTELSLVPRRTWRAAPGGVRSTVRRVGRREGSASQAMDALVTDVHIRSAIAGLRALGRAGLKTVALAPDRGAAGGLSRFATVRATGPDPGEDAAGFAESVARLAVEHGPLVVYPGTEDAIDPLYTHATSLGPAVKLPYPGWATLEALRDKRRLTPLAADVGLSTPEILFEGDAAELRDAGVSLPAVVKPARPGGTGSARVIESASDLERLLDGLPAEEPLLVQERANGRLMALGMVVGRDGSPAARIQQEASRSWPSNAGPSSLAVSVAPDEELVAQAASMLASAGYWGLAQLQFVRDGGVPKLIDVNPRFYGSMPLALASGVNLPAAWHSVALDRPTGVQGPYREGVTYRWVEADLMAALRGSPKGLLRRAPQPRVGAWWAGEDPLPALALGVEAVRQRVHRRLPGR